MAVTFRLDSGVEAHAEFSETFDIPSASDRESLGEGDFAKLIFRFTDGNREFVERMWVRVKAVGPNGYVGTLDNDPYGTDEFQAGTRVEFGPEHVIQIQRDAS
jgi:hypothetical protein